MGIDLELRFLDYETTDSKWSYAANRLSLVRNRDLWDTILRDLPQAPLPEGYTFYMGADKSGEDAYGQRLKYTKPEDVKNFLARHREIKGWNRQCFRFVANLPEDTRIFLYWC